MSQGLLVICILTLFLAGCAKAKEEPEEPPKLEIEPIEPEEQEEPVVEEEPEEEEPDSLVIEERVERW